MPVERLYGNNTPCSIFKVFVSVKALPMSHELVNSPQSVRLLQNHSLSGRPSLLSSAYICQQSWSCLRLLRQEMDCALAFALLSAGKRSEARIAMMAITTSSSMSVKARPTEGRIEAMRYFEY